VLNPHLLPYLEKLPGLRGKPRFGGGLYASNLSLINGQGFLPNSNQLNNPRNGKYREPICGVELTKHISGKEGKLDLLESIRPSVLTPVQGQERLQPSNS
jgi:hypothetical protein